MIDGNKLLRAWLLTPSMDYTPGGTQINPLLPLIDAQRVWGGGLPEGFDPAAGAGIVVVRGGSGITSGGIPSDEIPLWNPHMRVTVWCNKNEFQIASDIFGAVSDWIDQRNNVSIPDIGYVIACNEVIEPQDLKDPSTGFATVFGFFDMSIRDFQS